MPVTGDGISTVALSVITESRGWSSTMASPTATKQLALAAAMLKRVSEQGGLRSEAELRLYLEVLARQAKHQGAAAGGGSPLNF